MKKRNDYVNCYLYFKQMFKVFVKLLPSRLTAYTESLEGSRFVIKNLLMC